MKVKFLQTILNHSSDVLTCCFSGRILAIGSADKLVRLFAIDADGSGFSELPQSPLCAHGYAVNYCQFTPLGTMLASCSQDGKAVIWDVRTGEYCMVLVVRRCDEGPCSGSRRTEGVQYLYTQPTVPSHAGSSVLGVCPINDFHYRVLSPGNPVCSYNANENYGLPGPEGTG